MDSAEVPVVVGDLQLRLSALQERRLADLAEIGRLRQANRALDVATASRMDTTARLLAAISTWIDDGNAGRDREAATWGRIAKVSEEQGEAIAAFIGATGQNPRKGFTHTMTDVVSELLDVALTALAAVEHLTGNQGNSIPAFEGHVLGIAQRADLLGATS